VHKGQAGHHVPPRQGYTGPHLGHRDSRLDPPKPVEESLKIPDAVVLQVLQDPSIPPRNPQLGLKICLGFRTIPTIRTGLYNPAPSTSHDGQRVVNGSVVPVGVPVLVVAVRDIADPPQKVWRWRWEFGASPPAHRLVQAVAATCGVVQRCRKVVYGRRALACTLPCWGSCKLDLCMAW
jgi:hypothetical protein